MLFYSGTINAMGEVHHGNTVTDFMDQERQRGNFQMETINSSLE